MKENDIIICEKCYEENEANRNTCKYCGARLYKGDISNNEDKDSEPSENIESSIKTTDSNTNTVAKIIKIIAVISAIAGIILGLISLEELEVMAIVTIVGSIISSIFVYALGEIIQLLEDIKNK